MNDDAPPVRSKALYAVSFVSVFALMLGTVLVIWGWAYIHASKVSWTNSQPVFQNHEFSGTVTSVHSTLVTNPEQLELGEHLVPAGIILLIAGACFGLIYGIVRWYMIKSEAQPAGIH